MHNYVHVDYCNNRYPDLLISAGKDTSEPGKWRLDWLLRVILRLVGSVTPIFAAMGMANLIYVMTYGGLTGYIVCYFFPAILQLSSIRACKKKFSSIFSSSSGSPSDYIPDSDETTPLSASMSGKKRGEGPCNNQSYMTPYSIPGLSHPWFVAFMTGVVVVIFVLIVASLFVHPAQQSCRVED